MLGQKPRLVTAQPRDDRRRAGTLALLCICAAALGSCTDGAPSDALSGQESAGGTTQAPVAEQVPEPAPAAEERLSEAGWAGTYQATEGEGSVEISRHLFVDPLGNFRRFAIEVSSGACTGDFSGLGQEKEGYLEVAGGGNDETGEDACVIEARLSGGLLRLQESDACQGWHGNACSFSGTFRKTSDTTELEPPNPDDEEIGEALAHD